MPFFPEPQPQPEVNPYFMPIDIPANPMSAYLPLAGGTLTGDLIINANATINGTTNMNNVLDMGNNIIKNLADGANATDAATVEQIVGGSAITTQQTSALRLSQTRCTVNNSQIVNLSRITSAGVLMETKFFGELFGVVDALATNCFFTILLPFDSTEIDDISKIAVTANYRNTSGANANVIPVGCYVETNGAQFKITFSINRTLGSENFVLEFSAIAQSQD